MTGHSSSITSEKVTAGLMNLHPFNQLKDGTEFRTGGGQDDKKDQNPGAGSGTGHRTTNKRQRAAAASTRRRKGRTRSATRGTSRGGTAHGSAPAHGSAAAHGGPARRTCSADGSTAAHGHPARRAGTTHGTTHGDATFRAPADGRTTSSPGGDKSQLSGGDQSRGVTPAASGVPSATRLAPAGSAGRPGAHQSAVATTEPAKHASTAPR
jgi:hypothetical protein